MDFFPLYNSIRIALISTIIAFFISLAVANYIVYVPKVIKGIVDVVLTLPLVLPPTVVGYLVIRVCGPKRIFGKIFLDYFNIKLTMNWWSAIIVTSIVIMPLMYRTIRSSFESYNEHYTEIANDLGANKFEAFWFIKVPICKEGLFAGTILSFARALGEYGATSMICGYTPNKTATIATTVYQFWRTDNDSGALFWICINIMISVIVLLGINFLEHSKKIKR